MHIHICMRNKNMKRAYKAGRTVACNNATQYTVEHHYY